MPLSSKEFFAQPIILVGELGRGKKGRAYNIEIIGLGQCLRGERQP